jgi:hypothetical protein
LVSFQGGLLCYALARHANVSNFIPPVQIRSVSCFGLYHERPGFESDPAGKTNPGREIIPDGIGRPFFS